MWRRGVRGFALKDRWRATRFAAYLSILGPGIIAANAGNDAGGIATYSSVGASYGYRLLWILIPITIALGMVQEMCARMGAVTGKGLSDLIREQFGVRWTAVVMLALLTANGGVTVSEFVGIAAASELFGVPRYIVVPLSACAIWWLVVKGSYNRVERIFLAMSLVFFAYVASAVMAKPHWGTVAREAVRPSFDFNTGYLFTLVAVIGTTISPYMQIFVQSSVVEKNVDIEDYALTRADVWMGTVFAMMIAFFIVVSTAATLHVNAVEITSASDAALALKPFAGEFATYLFGIGLFGASMIAASVLPLSTAYSISEALGFEKGVSRSFREAPIFLGIFTFLIATGAFTAILPGISLFRVLIITQFVNGLLLPVVLIAVLRLASKKELMGEHANGRVFNFFAWLIVIVVSSLSVLLVAASVLGYE